MRSNRLFIVFVACVCLTAFLHAECTNERDHRSNKNAGILVTDLTIGGTQTLGSADLARIEGKLAGFCFDEDSEELEERIRALFQDRGDLGSEVKSVRIKPSDTLTIPKPVRLEAEVLEGPRYKLAAINFVGEHAFSAAKLRSEFPLRKGDLFDRSKIASGIDRIRELYDSEGFVDWFAIPQTQILSDATVVLTMGIGEGPRYRMGKLEVFAGKELSDRLKGDWEMPEGAVFDPSYIGKYVDANHSLLPVGFTSQDVRVVHNCPDASVTVVLVLGPTAEPLPKKVDCEKSSDAAK